MMIFYHSLLFFSLKLCKYKKIKYIVTDFVLEYRTFSLNETNRDKFIWLCRGEKRWLCMNKLNGNEYGRRKELNGDG